MEEGRCGGGEGEGGEGVWEGRELGLARVEEGGGEGEAVGGEEEGAGHFGGMKM